MIDERATLHVVFGMAAAGSIREALTRTGRKERVIGCPDDLSFGPINPPSADLRRTWAASFLNYEFDEVIGMAETFWADATAPDILPIAWVCRSNAGEHASFLEFVWRMSGRCFDLIDATGIEVASLRHPFNTYRPWSLGVIAPDQIIASALERRRAAFPREQAEAAKSRWSDLRAENAPFRVLREGRLVSAPLTCFDGFLEQYASTEWQKAARLIGETMGRMQLELVPQGQSPSDMVLFGRMIALGEAGVLDVEGNGPHMRDYRVRRRNRPA